MTKTPEEAERWARAVRLARVDSQIEGLVGNPDDDAIFDAYARGEIDGDEFRRRVLASIPKIGNKNKSAA